MPHEVSTLALDGWAIGLVTFWYSQETFRTGTHPQCLRGTGAGIRRGRRTTYNFHTGFFTHTVLAISK